jgi:hypothetical protein
MLHDDQVTSAPRATRVSMRTAVWMVMWRQPAIRAPLRGWSAAYLARVAIKPGISFSARSISLRPKAARERSATLNFPAGADIFGGCSVAVRGLSRELRGYAGESSEGIMSVTEHGAIEVRPSIGHSTYFNLQWEEREEYEGREKRGGRRVDKKLKTGRQDTRGAFLTSPRVG